MGAILKRIILSILIIVGIFFALEYWRYTGICTKGIPDIFSGRPALTYQCSYIESIKAEYIFEFLIAIIIVAIPQLILELYDRLKDRK